MKNFRNDREYLADFFEHAPIGFHAFGPDRLIIDMNQTELDMLGYTKEEVIRKKTWADLIVPREIPLFEKHWQEINRTGEVRNLDYTLVRKDGQRRKVILNASARFDSTRKLLNTRGSVVDITELHQMALTVAASRKKLNRYMAGLEKNNVILFNCIDQWENEKLKLYDNIRKNMEGTISPLMEKLKRRGSSLDRRNLMLLEKSLQDLTSGFAIQVMDKKWRLSAREIEICKMIKSGFKTKDIADLLFTSVRTVEHHRNHIRKKLGIVRPSAKLEEYLKTFIV
jgi:PAS domain S-box-containing protein